MKRAESQAALLEVLKLNEHERAGLTKPELAELAGLTMCQFGYALAGLRDNGQVINMAPVVVSVDHRYGIASARDEIREYVLRMLRQINSRTTRVDHLLDAGDAKFGETREWRRYRKDYRRLLEDTVELMHELG